jgi:hypothetical protein
VSCFKTGLSAVLAATALALASTATVSAQDRLRDRTPGIENDSLPRLQRRRALRVDPPPVRGFRSDVPSMRNAEPSSPIYDYMLSRPPSSTLVAPMR